MAAAGAGFRTWRDATRPIGEGELFVQDIRSALAMTDPQTDPGRLVRQIRNELRIEAVSFIDPEGTIAASTAPALVGAPLDNGVLAFGHGAQRFVAVAAPLTHDITIDGLVEWEAGDVLYQVLQPVEGGSLLLEYDIEELLGRRQLGQGVPTEALRLAGLTALAIAVFATAVVGRARTARRNRELAREAALLRAHADELGATNVELDEARRRAEAALALAEEKNRVRAEFVLMINHELRTPLTSVVSGAKLLESDPTLDAETRAEILAAMVLDGSRLEEMVDQMLAVARIENRGLNIEFTRIEADRLCGGIVAGHPDLIHTDHDGALPPAISDELTLTQLIHSLADNALTHGAGTIELTCTDGVDFEPMIEVGRRPRRTLTFVVSDDGPGIDPEFLPRIFEKYEKSSFSPGTGLGLYLARMMIEALGGSIAVTTSPSGTKMAVSVRAASRTARAPVGVR